MSCTPVRSGSLRDACRRLLLSLSLARSLLYAVAKFTSRYTRRRRQPRLSLSLSLYLPRLRLHYTLPKACSLRFSFSLDNSYFLVSLGQHSSYDKSLTFQRPPSWLSERINKAIVDEKGEEEK